MTTDENGNQMFVPGGCSSGYWQSVQLPDEDNTPIDYNNLVEVDASSESFNDADESNVLPSDGITYTEYQTSDGWPNVLSVMPAALFVKYNGDRTACLRLAREQIGKLGYIASGFSITNGLLFFPYNENNSPQVNLSQTKVAVTYINQALQQNIPVIVGIDYAPGAPLGNKDGTTNHFVVIVGAGTDSNGKYYRFFDSGTAAPARGTSRNNKLYYDENTGLISGHSQVGSLSNLTYKVTQVRKSVKK